MTREEYRALMAEKHAERSGESVSDRRQRRAAEKAEELRAEQAAHPGQFKVETFPLPPWGQRAVFWIPRWTVPVGAVVLIGAIVLARRG